MVKINIFVLHNTDGEIMAIGHHLGTAQCIPIRGGNHSIFETEIDEEQLAKLPQTHRVDVRQQALVSNG